MALLLSHKVYTSVFANENWIRLQRTFVLAWGEPMYPAKDTGPVFTAIYGPVSALAYLAAVLGRSPEAVMRIASASGIACFFLPVLWVFTAGRFGAERGRLYGLIAFFACAFMPFLFPSLRTAAFLIHADAPTLGLMTLACGSLYFGRSYLLAAVFAAIAVWSKQVALPFGLILGLYVWARDGGGALARYLVYLAAATAAVTALVFAFFPAKDVLFNVFTVPAHQPWKENGGWPAVAHGLPVLLRESLIMLILTGAAVRVLKLGPQGTRKLRPWLNANRWFIWVWAGVAMAPAAAAGFLKIGGSRNALSYTTFFLTVGAFLAFIEPLRRPADFEAASVSKAKRLAVAAATVLLLVQAPALYMKYLITPLPPNAARTAYDFIRRHPGEAYFPRLGLIHMLAEGKIYHDSSALMDRAWAGMRLSEKHVRAHIPDKIRLVAFIRGTSDDRGWIDIPEIDCRTTDPELPGFRVYIGKGLCSGDDPG